MTSDLKFNVGDAVLASPNGYNYQPATVERVYKNGNFLLAGSKTQWRQSGVGAGGDAWDRSRLVHHTDPSYERLYRLNRARGLWNDIKRRMQLHESSDVPEAVVDALVQVLERLRDGGDE